MNYPPSPSAACGLFSVHPTYTQAALNRKQGGGGEDGDGRGVVGGGVRERGEASLEVSGHRIIDGRMENSVNRRQIQYNLR